MGLYEIKNDFLTANINSLGAEVYSVKNESGTEFIWQAEQDVWGRHAPILFPVVGRLKDDYYKVDGNDYQMGQHGFARDREFEVTSQTETMLEFTLEYDDESLTSYPYKFSLKVVYQLIKDSLQISYLVDSLESEKIMNFSVGAHPGFNIPFDNQLEYEDYQIKLEPQETLNRIPLKESNIDLSKEFSVDNQNEHLTHDLFKNDAIIYRLNNPLVISISSEQSEHSITLDTGNAKFVGLWSQYPSEGNFVCIEPWWGIADKVDTDHNLETKYGINKLNPKERFEAYYSISFK
ncbi:aldose 1-epimerase family protein [Companilactobacillus metriopterae]|uniref:aldose 1-epimerase family protein n=1 Tax=Companilactobacillus metriopterae TaxID=1909267 RepID=UPI00100AD503|nr:aldose 1-epimerase family protein [Companilactobacillus metriopterae]